MNRESAPPSENIFADRYKREFIEVACPLCDKRKIVCLPDESIPRCEFCKVDMVFKEVLTEGKY
jgi:ribosomal protein S27E